MGKRAPVIARTLGGYPARDATVPTQLFVLPVDIKNGVPENPDACAIAQCARRTMGTDYAVVFKTTAWLKVPKGDGFEILRYEIGEADRQKIEQFDRTGEMPAGGVTLRAPSARSLAVVRARANARNKALRWSKESKYQRQTGKQAPTGILNTRGQHKRPRTAAAAA